MQIDGATTLRVESTVQSWLTGLPRGAPRPAPPVRTAVEASVLRLWIGPLALMVFTPWLSLLFWVACAHHEGSLLAMAQAGLATVVAELPKPSLRALGLVFGWTAIQLALLELLPGKTIQGPPTPAGERPEYKLNGVAAWVVSHALVVGAWAGGAYRAASFYATYGELVATLTLFAFAFCGLLYWKGRRYPTSRDAVYTGNPVFDFFQGVELHPRLFGVNLKQLINCRVSMMGWSATFVVFALAQHELYGSVSTSMIASVAVLVIYLFKFFWWEDGYFHSIDIILDRFGYYICWGVLVWVPAVYCLPALWLTEHPIALPWPVAAAIVAIGVLAIWVNYDADAQRQRVRATDGKTTVWGKPPELIRARYTTADGVERDSVLLVSGWWGVARHFHYVPELTLAAAWTIPAGFTHFIPWFYWVFLFILLMDRARRDEKKCAAKYGDYWRDYVSRVRWRVVPGVY
ncbi:MAG: 7-dehydrocholesterol reductase [Myxococcales bacterium]|nr:7-dehydrocholesterol reductase [Myxococcales bacterium]MCB9520540.1 7-dehydrocholesterol reductase [Myxococcales bacterium]